jgi:hypothetical protein
LNKVFVRTDKTASAKSVCFFEEVEMCQSYEPPVPKIEWSPVSQPQPSWREQAAIYRGDRSVLGARKRIFLFVLR